MSRFAIYEGIGGGQMAPPPPAGPLPPITIPQPPAGFVFLVGADGAPLIGADGALLMGVLSL